MTDEAPSGTRLPIESYRHRIPAVFNINDDKLDLAGARKAIRECRQATNDLGGSVDLMPSAANIGWGYGDFVSDVVDELADQS